MSTSTTIEWTDRTWGPTRGCSVVSAGCKNCYAQTFANRFAAAGRPFHGFVENGKWTGRVELVPDKLTEPLRWRKPSRVFVNSMSDLFHESLPDEAIDRVFAVMALAPHLTFQVLTKRAERMRAYFGDLELRALSIEATTEARDAAHRVRCDDMSDKAWSWHEQTLRFETGLDLLSGMQDGKPLPNVHLGVSVENQETADERIPHLLATPAAVRFLSVEPLLGPVDLWGARFRNVDGSFTGAVTSWKGCGVDWVIVGGESGPGARPFDLAWARSILAQCCAAGVPFFFKQAGSRPMTSIPTRTIDGEWLDAYLEGGVAHSFAGPCGDAEVHFKLRDRKGGDLSEIPEDLRVREMP